MSMDTLDTLEHDAERLPSNVTVSRVGVDAEGWRRAADSMQQAGAVLLTLWGSDDRDRDGHFRIHAAYLARQRLWVIEHAMPTGTPVYPSLAMVFPVADRLQRAIRDLLGIHADGGDARPWLRHGGWPESMFPLRRDVDPAQAHAVESSAYPFVRVSGDGVHEIPVGPVHAGTIEPGHFRFSLVGEKVLRLEQRLGYTHKGVAKRFESMRLHDGHRLAARVCGDSAVAFSWAYCCALESMSAAVVPPRAVILRALALELERLANHLGDLGALGNDAGLAFGLTQFSALKERLLRRHAEAFGQRYLFDLVIPGGVSMDPQAGALDALSAELSGIERDVRELRTLYTEHAGLQDRLLGTGSVGQAQARSLGALGLAARACGLAHDLRADMPWPPYDRFTPTVAACADGDVAARVQVRFAETLESLQLCGQWLGDMPAGEVRMELPDTRPGQQGIGLIEGWRGPVMVALESGVDGGIRRCHVHDPSWQNWLLLEWAVLDNIVADFPLINKSFNLSYSGHDG